MSIFNILLYKMTIKNLKLLTFYINLNVINEFYLYPQVILKRNFFFRQVLIEEI